MTSSIKTDGVRSALGHLRASRNTDREACIRAAQELVGAARSANGGRLPRPVIRRLITEIRDVLGHDDPTPSTATSPSQEQAPGRCRLCKTNRHWRLGPEPWCPWICERCHPCPHSHDCVDWTVEAQP